MVKNKQSANRHRGNPDTDNCSRCTRDLGLTCAATAERRCSAMIADGINWMARRVPKGTRIRSSKYPRTGMKIGNEINWRKRITSNQETHCLGVPRHARSPCEIKRMHILLDAARPILQPFNHCSHYHDLVTLGGSRAVCNSKWSRAKRSATLSAGLMAPSYMTA